MVNASALSARTAANPGFIGLDVFPRFSADTVLVGANHADTELMQNLEGGFVARQSKLPLKLDGRDTWRLAGDQVGRPEPYRERRMRALHDGTGGKAGVATAMTAAKHARACGNVSRLISHPAVGTDKPVAPSCALKVGRARSFIREQALKFRKRLRERQIIPLKYVDCHGRPTFVQMLNILPVVGGCDNRISTVYSFPPRAILSSLRRSIPATRVLDYSASSAGVLIGSGLAAKQFRNCSRSGSARKLYFSAYRSRQPASKVAISSNIDEPISTRRKSSRSTAQTMIACEQADSGIGPL